MEPAIVLTSHATCRVGQRGIGSEELFIVLKYGTEVYNGGALFVFMRKKDIPASLKPSLQSRLEGITVILDPISRTIITAYKNRGALKEIKRKSKRLIREHGYTMAQAA